MSRILIRIAPDGELRWLSASAPIRVQRGVPPVAADDRLWVIFPAEDVLLMSAPRVARSLAQMQQALPYAIEDQLAAAIETQHVAWASAADPEQVSVAVVARERLDALLASLRARGLEPDVLVPESLLLPWQARAATVLIEPNRAVLRYGEARAFVGQPDELLMFAGSVDAGLDGVLVGVQQSPLPLRNIRCVDDALLAYVDALSSEPPLNLLQGDYAPRRRAGRTQRAWRWAAGLAVAGLLLSFAHGLLERAQLASLVDRQRAEMADLYRAAVPGATRIVDAEQQLRSALAAAGRGRGDASLSLLAQAAPGLSTDPRIQLDALELRDDSLELVVSAPDVAALDALRQRLAVGAAVELTAATPGSKGVEGRLRLSGGSR
jgi:general secretion pathway protein L